MPLHGIKVLVVEDDQDHRELARILLTDLGARVTVAANGEEGLKRLIVDGCPDLILCDLRMPGMDGFTFARELREYSPWRRRRRDRLATPGLPTASHQYRHADVRRHA